MSFVDRYYNPHNPQNQTYEQFLLSQKQQQQQFPSQQAPIVRVARLEPPSPHYKSPITNKQASYSSPNSQFPTNNTHNNNNNNNTATTVNSGNSQNINNSSNNSPQQTLPKINFKISDALLKDPTPFTEKLG